MANYETVIYEKVEDKIYRLTLNRPEKLNALSQKLLHELDSVMDEYESNAEASVLIIRGAGRAFSAGYDLQGTQHPGSTFTVTNDRLGLHKTIERWQRLWAINKPTIAQVHGYCLAGGTEFIGHCDIVFASEDAQFGHPAGRSLGILPTMSMWPVLMGPRKTKEYFFTGDYMSAKEALEWHLINRVFPKDKLEEETMNYARRVAMVPAELLMLHKAAVNRYLDIIGIRAAEQSSADIDVIAHQTDTVKNWMKASREKGLKGALTERDRPFAKESVATDLVKESGKEEIEGTMIKRALMGAAAFLVVACNTGSPPGSATNTVGGADVVASTQTKMTTATKSLSLDPGKSAQAGQVAIADVITYGGPKVTITAPDGWQLIRDDSTPTTRQSLYWHPIAANDPSPTWSFSTPVDAQGAIVLLSNVASGAPVDMSNAKTGTGGDVKSSALTTTTDGDLVLILKATDFSNAPLTAQTPTDMTAVVAQQNAPHQYWILGYWQGQNGTTEETEFSFPQLFNWVAAQVAIKHGSH